MARTFKVLLFTSIVTAAFPHTSPAVVLSIGANIYIETATEELEKARETWLSTEDARNQQSTSKENTNATIQTLIKKRAKFCKKNSYNAALIKNSYLHATLAHLKKESGNSDKVEETHIETFDQDAHRGARLVCDLFLKKECPGCKKYRLSLRSFYELLTFFYLHTIRPREGLGLKSIGAREATFVIDGSHPAFNKFLENHYSRIEKKFGQKAHLFIDKRVENKTITYTICLRSDPKTLLPPMFGRFRAFSAIIDNDQTTIELHKGTGADDEVDTKRLLTPGIESCDCPSQISPKIIDTAAKLLNLTDIERPITARVLIKTIVKEYKKDSFNTSSKKRAYFRFLFGFYTKSLLFYSPQIAKRQGSECRIGPEVFVSAFFRGLSPQKNEMAERVKNALQGLFIELIELRKKYYETFTQQIETEDCYDAFQQFSDHALSMSHFIEDPTTKNYVKDLALISRYYINRYAPFPLHLVFDTASHPNIKRYAAAWIVADIIKKMCHDPREYCFKGEDNDKLQNLDLKTLQSYPNPFEHALFSSKNGLLKQAQRLARHFKKKRIIDPLLGVVQRIHLASKIKTDRESLKLFCTKFLKLWETALGWIMKVNAMLEIPPPDLNGTKKKETTSSSLKEIILESPNSSQYTGSSMGSNILNTSHSLERAGSSNSDILTSKNRTEKNKAIFKTKSCKNVELAHELSSSDEEYN